MAHDTVLRRRQREQEHKVKDLEKKVSQDVWTLCSYVARSFGISPQEVLSSSKMRTTTIARKMFFYVLRKDHHLSLSEISYLTNKHTSSVVYAVKSMEQMLHQNDYLKKVYRGIPQRNYGIKEQLKEITTELKELQKYDED